MAQQIVNIPRIGNVILSKRKGTRSMRLSITAAGTVRVGLPQWMPYRAGIEFARSKADWINQHMETRQTEVLKNGDRIGKSHRLFIKQDGTKKTPTSRVKGSEIVITAAAAWDSPAVQAKAKQTSERALKAEAEHLLPQRLQDLAARHGFSYKSVRIRKLTSRWGSCSSDKVITLSYYLMQLPWPLIDYVLVHELIHTKHLNHSAGFWAEFEAALPGAKKLRKETRTHHPRVTPQN